MVIDCALKCKWPSRLHAKAALSAITNDPKYFYAYARKKQKMKSNLGPLKRKDGMLTENSREIAEALKKQYDKVYSTL